MRLGAGRGSGLVRFVLFDPHMKCSIVEARLLDPVDASPRRRRFVEAELLDPEPRPVVRHPSIYDAARPRVMTAPAARTTPEHFDGEPAWIMLPGERRVRLVDVMVFASALVTTACYCLF
jgi:hypothetical protein